MKARTVISICEELLEAVLEAGRRLYPKEAILLLRGKSMKNVIVVSDLVVPPLATYGRGLAGIRTHMLPMDFSIIGTFHSHPSGNVTPSAADLNHQFGSILMIAGYPYKDENNVAVYNRAGKRLELEVTRPKI
jgi:proteasome lid subunit RPN8/RPN11